MYDMRPRRANRGNDSEKKRTHGDSEPVKKKRSYLSGFARVGLAVVLSFLNVFLNAMPRSAHERIRALENSVETLKDEKTELANNTETLEGEKRELEEKLDQLKTKMGELEGNFSLLEDEKSALADSKKKLEEKVKELEKKVENLEADETILENKVTKPEAEKTVLGNEVKHQRETTRKREKRSEVVQEESKASNCNFFSLRRIGKNKGGFPQFCVSSLSSSLSPKSCANQFKAFLQSRIGMVHFLEALPIARYKTFIRASSVGNAPLVFKGFLRL